MKDLGVKRKDYELVEPAKSEDKETVDYPSLYLRDDQVAALDMPEEGEKFKATIEFEVTSKTVSKGKDGKSSSVDLKILSIGDIEAANSESNEMEDEEEEDDNEEMDDTTEKNKKLRPVNMGLLD
jgi:hypothetical protein